MSHCYPKSDRLRKRREFQKISKVGQRSAGDLIALQYHFDNGIRPKLGITVTRKFGKAHQRNRFKRLVRESFRLISDQLPHNLILNVRPRLGSGNPSMQDILNELKKLTQNATR